MLGYISTWIYIFSFWIYHLQLLSPWWPMRGHDHPLLTNQRPEPLQSLEYNKSRSRKSSSGCQVAALGLTFSVSHYSSHNILKIWLNPFYLAEIMTNNIIFCSQKVNYSLLFKKVFFLFYGKKLTFVVTENWCWFVTKIFFYFLD